MYIAKSNKKNSTICSVCLRCKSFTPHYPLPLLLPCKMPESDEPPVPLLPAIPGIDWACNSDINQSFAEAHLFFSSPVIHVNLRRLEDNQRKPRMISSDEQ